MNIIAFEDCVPGVVSTIALIVVNLIDPERYLDFIKVYLEKSLCMTDQVLPGKPEHVRF
jgi:hypothetical protein